MTELYLGPPGMMESLGAGGNGQVAGRSRTWTCSVSIFVGNTEDGFGTMPGK